MLVEMLLVVWEVVEVAVVVVGRESRLERWGWRVYIFA